MTIAGELKASPGDSSLPEELSGKWDVSYHPNRAVRQYEFRPDGTAVLREQPGWSGSLSPCVDLSGNDTAAKRWKLAFDGDSEDRFELLTWTADGRLLVEHFNPGATALPAYDQLGIGVRPQQIDAEKRCETQQWNAESLKAIVMPVAFSRYVSLGSLLTRSKMHNR